MQPYQTDYELVVDEILKRTTGEQRLNSDVEKDIISNRRQDFTEEISLMQRMESYNAQIKNLADNISNVENVLKEIDQYITSGLDISVTGDNKIKVTAGYGVAFGKIQTLTEDQEVTITFDDNTPVYYVQINEDAVVINKVNNTRMLTVGKIIVPYPGQTVAIQDNRPWAPYGEDTGYNGWIESAKDAFFGEDTVFDDASREIIRDALSQIAAEIIFGTLTASESLKITNVHGTAELTSRAMQFKNSDGEVVSYYGSDYARIGDIGIYPTYLASINYLEGVSGFKIDKDGRAEFEDAIIRGKLSTSVFEKNTTSSLGGNFTVTKSDILGSDMTALDSSVLEISGDESFNVGDILVMRNGFDFEWMRVTDNSIAPIYSVERDMAGSYASNANPEWKKGTGVISYGPAGQGLIYMTASDENAPYISILTHEGEPWSAINERARFGNLNGFLDYTNDAYGIAIGDASRYFKYDPENGLRIRGDIDMDSGSIGAGIIQASSFVDTVYGDIALGAVYARTKLRNNAKWTEEQTVALLTAGAFTKSSGVDDLVIDEANLLQVPTIGKWDDGSHWDEGGHWDYPTQEGEWNWTSSIRDMGSSFYCLPTLEATRYTTDGSSIVVTYRYSRDNVSWSNWNNTYPSLSNSTTTYYADDIVQARYLQYRIQFIVTDGALGATLLENIYLKALAVYINLIFPNTSIGDATEGYRLSNLSNYFGSEYSISYCVHGVTLLSLQVINKSDPPEDLQLKLLDDSDTSVIGTFDLVLDGY